MSTTFITELYTHILRTRTRISVVKSHGQRPSIAISKSPSLRFPARLLGTQSGQAFSRARKFYAETPIHSLVGGRKKACVLLRHPVWHTTAKKSKGKRTDPTPFLVGREIQKILTVRGSEADRLTLFSTTANCYGCCRKKERERKRARRHSIAGAFLLGRVWGRPLVVLIDWGGKGTQRGVTTEHSIGHSITTLFDRFGYWCPVAGGITARSS